jgi:hypothetical protein
MGAMETCYNRVIIPVDFMWVRLKDTKGIPITDDVESVNTKINDAQSATALIEHPRRADALVGLRCWHLGTTLTLQPTQVSNGYYGAANWVDAVAGARFQANNAQSSSG